MAAAHQTVVLARGRHRDPSGGVCAMELSSMLAHERLSDRPKAVCPVIAAFLRGYNDAVDDELRQTLFGLAADVVGSRTDDPAVKEERGRALVAWALEVWAERRRRLPWPPVFAPGLAFAEVQAAGGYVGRRARRDRSVHERTLVLLEELALSPGGRQSPAPSAASGRTSTYSAGASAISRS